jgi:hypothetical protein
LSVYAYFLALQQAWIPEITFASTVLFWALLMETSDFFVGSVGRMGMTDR